jgi:hypothetical protein
MRCFAFGGHQVAGELKPTDGARTRLNRVFAVLSVVLGTACFALGIWARLGKSDWVKSGGPWIVGLWVLAPPIFFWCDWVFFAPDDGAERDRIKHTHDLSRNIWVALTAVLISLFGITWPFD